MAQPFLKVEVLKLEAELIQRSYDQDVKLRLGGVQVTQYHDKGEIFMINTPMASGIEEYLIVVRYVTVCPSELYIIINNTFHGA